MLSVVSLQRGGQWCNLDRCRRGFELHSNPGFVGAGTISYTISDGTSTAGTTDHRGAEYATSGVATATRCAGETLTIAAAAGLLANDSDGDSDALSVLSFSAAPTVR